MNYSWHCQIPFAQKQIYAIKLQTSNLHRFSINKMLLPIVEQEIF